jgi:hypothetical protein
MVQREIRAQEIVHPFGCHRNCWSLDPSLINAREEVLGVNRWQDRPQLVGRYRFFGRRCLSL